MFLGYNTNGFAHHRLDDAVTIMAEIGYRGVALTLDVHHLNPFGNVELPNHVGRFGRFLDVHRMRCVIETGARFILDPWEKHQPTLLSADPDDRQCRHAFLEECVKISASLNRYSEGVSFWSGMPDDDASPRALMLRLSEHCKRLADYAAERDVRLAFEPEPGMFIDTLDKFADLHAKVNHPAFGLTIDVGHLVCNGELPVSRFLTDWKHVLWNVHIEDMRRGVHDHLMFGEGEVDFADVFAGLWAAGYAGGVYVELSRHSHNAVETARKSFEFLSRFVPPHSRSG
jgi:sugar phosphate isomerase/epimerase